MWNPNSFEDREIPPMSAAMFSALVTARLRAVDGVEIQGGKGLQLRLRVNGKDTTTQLERYYERYRANPDALNPVIDQFISALATGTSDASAGNRAFAEVRDELLPRLMTAQQWMMHREQGLRLVIRSLVQDLGAALILDAGDTFEYVQLDAIPAWEIDAETAYESAKSNLERTTAHVSTTVNGEGSETLLVAHGENVSALILLETRLADWQARIEGELVLAVPTHDLLLGFAREHPAFDDLRMQVAEDAHSPLGLMPHLLRVRQGELELLAT